MRISTKLKLNSLVVLALVVVNVAVAIFFIQRMMNNTRQLTEVEDPLERAVLEMEINADETARAVLDYVRAQKKHNLDKIQDSKRDFEWYAMEFDKIAETPKERELGRQVAELYQDFETLGNEITSLLQVREVALQEFRTTVAKTSDAIDEFIDTRLRNTERTFVIIAKDENLPETQKASPDDVRLEKRIALLVMEDMVDALIPRVESYLNHQNPAMRQELQDAQENFNRYEARLRKVTKNDDSVLQLDEFVAGFAKAETMGNQIAAQTDELNEKLGKFELSLEEIDRILDDEIQILIHAEKNRAKQDVKRSGELAIGFTIVAGFFIFVIVLGVHRFVAKGIIDATRQLTKGAAEFGRGYLDYRIKLDTEDELGALAGAFNEMADKRKQAQKALRQNEENLHLLVEQRTAALRESEERYRAVAEDTPVLICRFWPVGKIAFVNQACCRHFEKTFEELVDSSFLSLFPVEDRETMKDNILALTADSPTQSYEHSTVVSGGEIRWQRWTKHASYDAEGKVVIYQAIGEDITERKRAEQDNRALEEKLRHAKKMDAVGQLASGVAHEFNNLLVGIRGNAELLIRTVGDLLPAQSRGALSDIERAGSRAYNLTNKLLSFAREKSPDVTVFDVNRAVMNSKRMFVNLIGSDISLSTVETSEPAFVCADEVEIEQVFLNLVLNARDAMPLGGTISIQTRVVTLDERDIPKDCKAGHFVELSVTDNGCGMSPETCERVFEPFFTTKPVGEGTGLGLTVAYADLSKHGGFLAIDSREGVGTTVTVFLPQSPEPVAAVPAESVSSLTDFSGGEGTILVCDDDDIVRPSVDALLQSVGYSVIAVASAVDALVAAEVHGRKISLLLTDITMPGMNGIELGREINRRHPDIKVLYMSGHAAGNVMADDDIHFLHKGGPSSDLLLRVRQLLDWVDPATQDPDRAEPIGDGQVLAETARPR